jgi:hypothetical protein
VSNPEYQGLDPAGVPSPVTPAAGPADPSGYAMVTPDGRGPAPYDIQAAMDTAAIAAAADAAGAVSGAGIVYPRGTRQAATETLLNSPQGFSAGGGLSGYDITPGWSGEPDESWANSVQAPTILETPIQGTGDYPGTMQDGLQKYGTS